jgi:hypothetical protein
MELELNPVVKMLEIKIMVEEIEVDGDGREGTDNNQLEAQSKNNVDATRSTEQKKEVTKQR